MGRELRMVPPDYMSGDERSGAHPMFDETFEQACAKWDEAKRKWDAGEDPDRTTYKKDDGSDYTYIEWSDERPDDPSYYRDWQNEEATWFQIWENVSEGTPITPSFETQEELRQYLVTEGTDWSKPWTPGAADGVLSYGSCPSMVMAGGRIYRPEDGVPE